MTLLALRCRRRRVAKMTGRVGVASAALALAAAWADGAPNAGVASRRKVVTPRAASSLSRRQSGPPALARRTGTAGSVGSSERGRLSGAERRRRAASTAAIGAERGRLAIFGRVWRAFWLRRRSTAAERAVRREWPLRLAPACPGAWPPRAPFARRPLTSSLVAFIPAMPERPCATPATTATPAYARCGVRCEASAVRGACRIARLLRRERDLPDLLRFGLLMRPNVSSQPSHCPQRLARGQRLVFYRSGVAPALDADVTVMTVM